MKELRMQTTFVLLLLFFSFLYVRTRKPLDKEKSEKKGAQCTMQVNDGVKVTTEKGYPNLDCCSPLFTTTLSSSFPLHPIPTAIMLQYAKSSVAALSDVYTHARRLRLRVTLGKALVLSHLCPSTYHPQQTPADKLGSKRKKKAEGSQN